MTAKDKVLYRRIVKNLRSKKPKTLVVRGKNSDLVLSPTTQHTMLKGRV